MKEVDKSEKQLISKNWALKSAVILFIVLLILYAINFTLLNEIRGPLSNKTGTWGEFGDYLGGVVNPIVGLITIWLLTASLKQSQEEMALTRRALEDAKISQNATEAVLRDQIIVSEQARDMNNAVALWRHHLEYGELLSKRINVHDKSMRETNEKLASKVATEKALAENLHHLMAAETGRLIKAYTIDK